MYISPPPLHSPCFSISHQTPSIFISIHLRMKTENSALDLSPSSPYSSTTTSLASSSIDSSSSSIPSTSSSPSSSPRCAGLDLLVKAIYQVTAGSIIGVPYIQKRVIRRRSRRIEFKCENGANGVLDCGLIKKKKRGAKKIASSKIQDSCIETWRPKSRQGRFLLSTSFYLALSKASCTLFQLFKKASRSTLRSSETRLPASISVVLSSVSVVM